MEQNDEVKKAKARIGFQCIIVPDCPFCHGVHRHNFPIGKGAMRFSECLQGEYILEIEGNETSNEDKPNVRDTGEGWGPLGNGIRE